MRQASLDLITKAMSEVEASGAASSEKHYEFRHINDLKNQKGIRQIESYGLVFPELRATLLKKFWGKWDKQPAEFIDYLRQSQTEEKTPSKRDFFELGSLYEALITDKVEESIVFWSLPEPEKTMRDRSNNEAMKKAFFAEEEDRKEGGKMRKWVRSNLFEKAQEMALTTKQQHPALSTLLEDMSFNHSFSGLECPNTGFTFRGEADGVKDDVCLEVKTCNTIRDVDDRIGYRDGRFIPSSFAYWIQLAVYRKFFGFNEAYFLFCATEPPYFSEVVRFDADDLDAMTDRLDNEVLPALLSYCEYGFLRTEL